MRPLQFHNLFTALRLMLVANPNLTIGEIFVKATGQKNPRGVADADLMHQLVEECERSLNPTFSISEEQEDLLSSLREFWLRTPSLDVTTVLADLVQQYGIHDFADMSDEALIEWLSCLLYPSAV